MVQLLFDILFWGVFGGGTAFIIFAIIMGIRQYKRGIAKQKEADINKDTAPIEA